MANFWLAIFCGVECGARTHDTVNLLVEFVTRKLRTVYEYSFFTSF